MQKGNKMKRQLMRLVGLLAIIFSGIAYAGEKAELKNIDLVPGYGNRFQIILQFSGSVSKPKSFSVETPASIIFDFENVRNKLSKEANNQKISDSVLKGIKAVETDNKTRLILDVSEIIPYDVSVEGHVVKISLVEEKVKPGLKNKHACSHANYQITAFDFRKGAQGEGKVIVDLSTSDISVDMKEDANGNVTALFAGAGVEDRLIKKYDVTDFSTPVKSVDISRAGPNVDLLIQTAGDYEKIAYQVDKQFVIELRAKTTEEKLAAKEANGQYTGDKISLNFQDIELRAVLQIIADFSGFNIITSDNVKGNVTLRLQDIPWDQALDIILKTEGLDKRQYGNVMLVGPASEIAAREKVELEGQKQVQDLGPMKSELIQVNYANAEDFATLLKDKTNSLMTSRGTVSVDKRTNTLLVQDVANKLNEIRALLKKLDIPVRQVEISTQIVTADKTLESTLGMQFGGGANLGLGHRRLGIGGTIDRARAIGDYTNGNGQSGVPASNADFTTAENPPNANIKQQTYGGTPPTVNNTEGFFSDFGVTTAGTVYGAAGLNPASAGFALAKLPNGTLLDLELQALEYETRSKTVARPKLVTMDQNKATVEQGVDIPYLEASSSGATSVSYKTAALKLEVTPHITPDDRISLDLQISNDTQGATVAAGPVVNTNRLQTKVLIDNGETVVLGGVLSILDTKQFAKVPFFGDLPFIGAIFRNRYSQYTPKELIIFLTPKIVNPLNTGS